MEKEQDDLPRGLLAVFENPRKPGGGNITEIFHKTGGPYLITFKDP